MNQQQGSQARKQARSCIAEGDLPQALQHLALALAANPNDEESLAILDAVAEHAPAAVELVEPANSMDFPVAAVRAHLLQRDGQYTEAVALLLAVIQLRPDVPFATWLHRWHSGGNPLLELSTNDVRKIASGIAEVLRQHPSVPAASEHQLTFECLLELVDGLRELSASRSKLALLASSLLRRVDEHRRAQRVAQETYEQEPTAGAAMLIALASRQLGQFATAIEWLECALEFDPGDTGYLLELADCHIDDGDFSAAATCYASVLDKEPEHTWARPASMYALWLTGDADQKYRLAQLAEQSEAAANILRRAESKPFQNNLPLPKDPAASAIFDVLEQLDAAERAGDSSARSGELQIRFEFPEAPSLLLALQLALGQHHRGVDISAEAASIQDRDPRKAKAPGATMLWSFRGARGLPTLPPADPATMAIVQTIARHPYRLKSWRQHIAERFAREETPPTAQQLMSTMVHPLAPASPRASLVWLQHVQMAAALCLLETDAVDDLVSLALGATDWCTNAAIVALAAGARERPELRAKVHAVFNALDAHIPKEGFCCYAYPLVVCWPWFDDSKARELWRRRRRLELRPN
jgi:tetratricopeptide (TPR) repeat protein